MGFDWGGFAGGMVDGYVKGEKVRAMNEDAERRRWKHEQEKAETERNKQLGLDMAIGKSDPTADVVKSAKRTANDIDTSSGDLGLQSKAPTNPNSDPYSISGGYGRRADGSMKGDGYYGALPTADGGVMTEKTIGVNINGKERQIPALVPGLTKEEIASLSNGDAPSQRIVAKAVQHADAQAAKGFSPYAEQSALPEQVQAAIKRGIGGQNFNMEQESPVGVPRREAPTMSRSERMHFAVDNYLKNGGDPLKAQQLREMARREGTAEFGQQLQVSYENAMKTGDWSDFAKRTGVQGLSDSDGNPHKMQLVKGKNGQTMFRLTDGSTGKSMDVDPMSLARQSMQFHYMGNGNVEQGFKMWEADRTHNLNQQKADETGRHNEAVEGIYRDRNALSRQALAREDWQIVGQTDKGVPIRFNKRSGAMQDADGNQITGETRAALFKRVTGEGNGGLPAVELKDSADGGKLFFSKDGRVHGQLGPNGTMLPVGVSVGEWERDKAKLATEEGIQKISVRTPSGATAQYVAPAMDEKGNLLTKEDGSYVYGAYADLGKARKAMGLFSKKRSAAIRRVDAAESPTTALERDYKHSAGNMGFEYYD